MKRILTSLILLVVLQARAVDSPPEGNTNNESTPYAVTERGSHHKVWERVEYETSPDGQQIPHVHSYTELSTGMHYKDSNDQWVESKEEVQILPNGAGAVANQGQHKVIFPPNLYDGMIELNTPDNKWLRSRVLGLSYFDPQSEQSVLIAALTNSVGELLGSNVVIYPHAFTDLRADVRCTYTRAGFEQDIILRECPPSPIEYGLNPETTRLQVLTEFFSPPTPEKKIQQINGLQDEQLDFGVMKIGQGKAFAVGDTAVSQRVLKTWSKLDNRDFLIEEVEYSKVESKLQELPLVAINHKPASPHSTLHRIAGKRILPAQRLAKQSTNTFQIAKSAVVSKPGYVLDYTAVSTASDFTFRSDGTYYVSGIVYLSGTTTIEGGAVIKYTNGLIGISIYGSPVCRTESYRPAVLTGYDDNSVGETMPGSTGVLSGYYGGGCLGSLDSSVSMKHLRACNLNNPFFVSPGSSINEFSHIQIVNCQNAFSQLDDAGSLKIDNGLFSCVQHVLTEFVGWQVKGNQLTVHRSEAFADLCDSGTSAALTNCLLVNVTNWYTGSAVTFTTNGAAYLTNDNGVFQTAGAGNYYLATNSPYRNAGTTNINSSVLADLKKRTTYPPVILSNITVSTATTLNPQAQRDTDTPDLGYHYDPIDYVTCWFSLTNATLTLTEGTAIASYYGQGIVLSNDCSIVSVGSPLNPNWFVRYSSVQEQPISLGTGSLIDVQPFHTSTDIPDGTFQFTKFACLAPSSPVYHLCNGSGFVYGNLLVQNCEFWNGTNLCSGDSNLTAKILNNLFNRSAFRVACPSTNVNLALSNNLFWNANISIQTGFSSNSVFFFNNSFDTCTFGTANRVCMNGKNGYINCNAQLNPTNANNIVLGSFNYTNGPLGDFYQVSTNFLDMGNVTADVTGLYHFTTLTNQVKETNSLVDIGYHYVAVNGSGQPVDTDGDGTPDYLEDANGNGGVDSGETDWQSATDMGLKVWITRPRNGSILP